MPLKEPEYRNSAGRLLVLLDYLAPRGLLDAVQDLYEVKSKQHHHKQKATVDFLGDLHQLYQDFQQDMREVEMSDQQRKVLLDGLTQVEVMLYPLELGNKIRSITGAERSLLTVCAAFIEQEGECTKDDLDEIRTSIGELRTQVESGDISPTLRKVLLELIRLAEDAISRYAIRGARGLKRAFKAMVGEVAELYGMADPEVKKSKAWSAITKLLTTVDSVASKLLKYRRLIGAAEGIRGLLGGGDDL